jgi:hypothetical protein
VQADVYIEIQNIASVYRSNNTTVNTVNTTKTNVAPKLLMGKIAKTDQISDQCYVFKNIRF